MRRYFVEFGSFSRRYFVGFRHGPPVTLWSSVPFLAVTLWDLGMAPPLLCGVRFLFSPLLCGIRCADTVQDDIFLALLMMMHQSFLSNFSKH